MKIALLGYGKMGKEIDTIAREHGHEIILKITSSNSADLTIDNLKKADVAIEFSRPEFALRNISLCLDAGTPAVVGTTGWYAEMQKVKDECAKKNGAIVFASNFSTGVNIFFLVNEYLSKLMSKQKEYSATIEETHHLQKSDKPSGTAITLANAIIKENKKYKQWSLEKGNENLHINSVREEGVTGTHTVSYQSEVDLIEIKHHANNRKGFAMGAIIAAEWIDGKKGFYEFKDIIAGLEI